MQSTGVDVFGKRYGEVLLMEAAESGLQATVYNTFGLNDCPAQLWDALDATAIAAEHGVLAAHLNGPRYWLMSRIEKAPGAVMPRATFGGLAMLRQATVRLSAMNPSPYGENRVDRRAVFVFDAGRRVYELSDPAGRRWIMQTYSQTVDKDLEMSDLSGLAVRLSLPEGWGFHSYVPDAPVVVDTTGAEAIVTQDDLANTYSLVDAATSDAIARS